MATKHTSQRSAIIIGSGIAGMATAVRLAVQGMKVSVYEKNEVPGGKLSVIENEGYHFDAGPSLFTQPENLRELFTLANETLEEYFAYSECDVACNYFFANGKKVKAYTDADKFAAELQEQLGEDPQHIDEYLKASKKLYNNTGKVFLDHSLHKRATWFNKRVLGALGAAKFPYLFSTLNKYNNKKFSTDEATQLFNRFATYNGSSPYKAPAMLSLIPHLEHNEGSYYAHGGMISIANAVYRLAIKKGVTFYFNTPVQRIIEHEGSSRGVVVHGHNHFADVVVSNVDAYFTYGKLLNDAGRAKKLLKQERSSSALIFYWGVSKKFPQLGLHNIFFSGDYRKEFECIFDRKILYADPTIYINITARHDESHAPAGTDNWFVMVNVPANIGQDWDNIQAAAREMIIKKLSIALEEDIAPLILTEQAITPVDIEQQTDSYMGSLYGTSSNSRMAAFFRHPNFTNKIKGLYFCGGSVHPGGGLPLCFKSARITGELIAKDLKKMRH